MANFDETRRRAHSVLETDTLFQNGHAVSKRTRCFKRSTAQSKMPTIQLCYHSNSCLAPLKRARACPVITIATQCNTYTGSRLRTLYRNVFTVQECSGFKSRRTKRSNPGSFQKPRGGAPYVTGHVTARRKKAYIVCIE